MTRPVFTENGFVYDYIFYDNHYRKPVSLLTIEESAVSHRSMAINSLISFLKKNVDI